MDETRGLGPQQITKSVGHGLLEEGESSLGRHVWVEQDIHERFTCFNFCHGVHRDCVVVNTDDGTQMGHCSVADVETPCLACFLHALWGLVLMRIKDKGFLHVNADVLIFF